MSSERGEHFTWGTSWATCSPVAFSFCSFCRVGALSGERPLWELAMGSAVTIAVWYVGFDSFSVSSLS